MSSSPRRRLLWCALALQLGLGALVLGVGADAATRAGVDVRINHGGVPRLYRLYVPSTVTPGTPAPLVLALHGLSGSPATMQAYTGLDALAHTQRFVVAYPAGRFGSWNAGDCCYLGARYDVDDVGYLAAVVAHIRRKQPVDRVFVTGFSNGGMMALRLACERPGLVTAVAAVQATMVTACAPSRPVHTMHVNGRRDPTIPYLGLGYSRWLHSALPPVPVTVGAWEKLNACSGLPEITAAGPVVRRVYPRCVGGSSVRLVTLADTAHVWPSAKADGFAATQEIWQFFTSVQQPVAAPGRAAVLTTRTSAGRLAAGGRTYVIGQVTGRFDVVIRAKVTVDALRDGSWEQVATGRTDLEGRFRIPVRLPKDAKVLVRYAGAGLPSAAALPLPGP